MRREDGVVVGAGSLAGQVAVHLARFARRLTVVAHGETLAELISTYLGDSRR